MPLANSLVDILVRCKYIMLLIFQFFLLVLYFVFCDYGGDDDVNTRGYEDTHVMIFIGFAFLMTFLKKYCYSALGFNWFLAALVVQWALLCQSYFHMKDDKIIRITKKTLLEADIMSATVLITFGALLGLASGTQLFVLAIIETAVGCTNLWLMEHIYKAKDVGGSMAIHTYGAYFGMGASTALSFKKYPDPLPLGAIKLNEPSYSSDVTAMIGSLFLWIFWPSFNSGLTSSDAEYQRAVINTYLSLCSATVTSFILSAMVSHKPGKFDMVHVQNSTLAGGVGVGAVANLFISPGGAISVGIGSGIISVMGYRYLTPRIEKLGVYDTCGVHNLHGTPGVFSGLLSALFAYMATPEKYGDDYVHIYQAMALEDRSNRNQAFFQLLALCTSILLAFVAGIIGGFIARTKLFTSLQTSEYYDDSVNWDLPKIK